VSAASGHILLLRRRRKEVYRRKGSNIGVWVIVTAEGWPSGLRRRSCPPEVGPPLAEKPAKVVVV
jgi:hypothetical protein